MYVCVRLVFDNALLGAVAGALDDNYETRTRFWSFLCTCVRLLFDNALQGTVAGVLDNNYETRT